MEEVTIINASAADPKKKKMKLDQPQKGALERKRRTAVRLERKGRPVKHGCYLL